MKLVTILTALVVMIALPARAVKIERLAGVVTQAGKPGKAIEVAAEQILVQFSPATTSAQRNQVLSATGLHVIREMSFPGWVLVGLPGGMSVLTGMKLIKGMLGVVSYHPNHIYRVNRVPNDPMVISQYALTQTNAFVGWEYETGSSNKVTIAMIDAGIDPEHPDLGSKLVNSGGVQSQYFDPVTGNQVAESSPTPACEHGTNTAGVAAAIGNNGIGIAGISWGAQLLSLRVFDFNDCSINGNSDCNSNPSCGTSDVAMANAIQYAISQQGSLAAGKIVINMSIGMEGACPGSCPGGNDCIALTAAALSSAVAAGIPIAIAAGNDGGDVNSPANCAGSVGGSGIIPVSATDINNNVAAFSSRGPELAANGVCAPGVNVQTTQWTQYGSYFSPSGTSFSAPHVAGLAALMLSAKPNLTPAQVQSYIRGGAYNINAPSTAQGAGRIDVYNSLRLALRGTLSTFEGEQKPIAFPNPFHPSLGGTVTFSIPPNLQGNQIDIKIYTIAGEFVRELQNQTWDGRNTAGFLVASGTYIFTLSTSAGKARGRFSLIR